MKKLLATLLIVSTFSFFTPTPALATGIARDSNAAGVATASSPLNYTLNNVAGNFLVVEVRTSGTPFTSCAFNTAVSYNGTGMTLLDSANGNGNDNCVYYWYLASPSTGSHSVSVTFSGTSASARSSAQSYSGVGGIESATKNTCQQTSALLITCAVTTQNDNDWVVGVANSGGGALTAGTNTSVAIGDDSGTAGILDTNAAQTPVGSPHSIQDNYNATGPSSLIAAALFPSTTVSTFNFWQFFGF